MELGKAFDVSNWSGPFTAGEHTYPNHRPLSAARPVASLRGILGTTTGDPLGDASKAACIREQGYDLGIIGTQHEPTTRTQMQSCRSASIALQAYVYLYFAGDPKAQVLDAIRRFDGFDVGMLWLDCEDAYAENMTEAAVIDWIGRAAQACEGKIRSGIYTARWWWDRQTGRSQAFKHFPLWNATADRVGDLTAVNYGGWLGQPYMEQYQFDTPICGVNTDLNVYQRATVPPPAPPKPEPDASLVSHLTIIRDHAQAALAEVQR